MPRKSSGRSMVANTNLFDQKHGPVHLVGVGGIGMSALALVLKDMGMEVSGCDQTSSRTLDLLRQRNIEVHVGHSEAHVTSAAALVYSSAVKSDNLELTSARSSGVPIYRRADFIASLISEKRSVAIAGTHGKTTTSAMIAHVLWELGQDPWWFLGGVPLGLPGHGRAGRRDIVVVEADEYDASFLTLTPTIAVVTNVEPEHLDYYGTFDALLSAFSQFVAQSQTAVICADDAGAAKVASSARCPAVVTYGFAGGEWRAEQVAKRDGGMAFIAQGPDGSRLQVNLKLYGRHNVLNALGALAVGYQLGLDMAGVASALGNFAGVERRIQLVGKWRGIPVYDDYAHHPTEIAATREALRSMLPGCRVIAVFQPHTYSRTRAMLDLFAAELAKFDAAVIMEVYPARDEGVDPISAAALAERVPGSYFAKDFGQARQAVEALRSEDCVVVTLGAGDVWKLAVELAKNEFGP